MREQALQARLQALRVEPFCWSQPPLFRAELIRLTDDAGVAGVHLYTFNHVAATWQWVQRTRAAVA
jgi:hypothetical protein